LNTLICFLLPVYQVGDGNTQLAPSDQSLIGECGWKGGNSW
jgi:hypothetical protein